MDNVKRTYKIDALQSLERLESISIVNLIKGIPVYFSVFSLIVKNIFSFPAEVNFRSPESLKRAIGFAFFSIIIAFFLLVPIMLIHEVNLPKIPFMLKSVFVGLVFVCISHIFFKLFGSTESFRTTATVYGFLVGAFTPIGIAIMYPILLSIGFDAINGTPEKIAEYASEEKHASYFRITWALQTLFGLFLWFVLVAWYSKSHEIGKFKVFLSLLFSGFIYMLLVVYVLNPIFNTISIYFEKYLFFV